MKLLGISAFYHDSAAALISDESGRLEILAAAQEERFTRKKFDESFPKESIKFCLKKANLEITEIDAIVFYDKPWITFERLIETHIEHAPKGLMSFLAAIPSWMSWKLNLRDTITKELKKNFLIKQKDVPKILFSSHHLSHAASAFFASPFEEAAILCMDGVGEWETTTIWKGTQNNIEPIKQIKFPHSIGLLYSAFTYFCGFKVNSGEYKLMGLAPFGKPLFKELIYKHLITVCEDGSFQLKLDYFDYMTGFRMTSKKFDGLFGASPRNPEDPVRQLDCDLAASIQVVSEEIIQKLAVSAMGFAGVKNLCLAGGVALNCVANGKIVKSSICKNIWIQPAAGDSGGSVGAALAAYYLHYGCARNKSEFDLMSGAFLGTEYRQDEIQAALIEKGVRFQKYENEKLALTAAAELMSQGKVIGIFQGRMEFGPRALGARSIVGDPRIANMQKKMNLKIKFRESFRPFAPAVLEEKQKDIFTHNVASPYMLITSEVREELRIKNNQTSSGVLNQINEIRSKYPSITHVDYTARIQTIEKKTNPLFYHFVSEFEFFTGCPLVINTSFNVRGEPIVESPHQALDCFINTDIDCLCIGNFIVDKSEQTEKLKRVENWSQKFERD